MELNQLFERMKLDHVCEQAAKRELDYRSFLTEALETEWRGRHLKGVAAAPEAGAAASGEDPGAVRLYLPAQPRS